MCIFINLNRATKEILTYVVKPQHSMPSLRPILNRSSLKGFVNAASLQSRINRAARRRFLDLFTLTSNKGLKRMSQWHGHILLPTSAYKRLKIKIQKQFIQTDLCSQFWRTQLIEFIILPHTLIRLQTNSSSLIA